MYKIAPYSLILILAGLAGCEREEPENQTLPQNVVGTTQGNRVTHPTPRQMKLWAESCALCHVTGVAGAPKAGNIDDWSGRLEQGQHVLLKNTLEGINAMPPLGYCMACEEDDFKALINFMAGTTE